MIKRETTYTVSAEAVQGNPDAKATFRRITIGQHREYLERDDRNDIDMLRDHLVGWSGIVGDDGNELPSPEHEPDVIDSLYLSELRALSRAMWLGATEDTAKN